MDLDEEPIPLISSFGASFCFYYAMPCTIDVGVVIINGHHHLRGGRSGALTVYQRAVFILQANKINTVLLCVRLDS